MRPARQSLHQCARLLLQKMYKPHIKISSTLFASEISACVGMNKYKSVEDAKMDVWKRWDPPSFREASERNFIVAHKTPEEVFASIGPSAQKLVSRAISSETEKAATEIVEVVINEKTNDVVAPEAVQAILKAASDKKPVDEACRKLVGAPKIADTLNKSLTADSSAADVKRVIDSVLVKDLDEARESVVHQVNTMRGTQNEHKGIASYEKAKRVKLHGKNTQFHIKRIGETSTRTKVNVGGRVDGLTNDKVIEVKSRRHRFFSTLPLYEKVQVQAYMFLTDKPIAEVVQKYDGMMRSDEYVADTEFWAEVCAAALKFASELENLIDAHPIP